MSEVLDDFEKKEKRIEIMFDFDNVWKSFEEEMNAGIKELLESLASIKKEQESIKKLTQENISQTKEALDIFLKQKEQIKIEADEIRELVETINSMEDKNITFVEADVEYLTTEIAKILRADTRNGIKEIRKEIGEKFKKTYVTAKMIDQQLALANKGLESVLQSCKEGNTNIATSEVLLYNLMETIRFIDTLSDNQKREIIAFDKANLNSNAVEFNKSNKRFDTRIGKIEQNLELFKAQTEQNFNEILDILRNKTERN